MAGQETCEGMTNYYMKSVGAGFRGRVKLNLAPPSFRFEATKLPPCASAIDRLMDRTTPKPVSLLVKKKLKDSFWS